MAGDWRTDFSMKTAGFRVVAKDDHQPSDWTAILPCPFCSNPGKLLSNAAWGSDIYGSSACVICTVCGAGGPCVEPLENMLIVDMNNLAIKRWNKRGNLAGAEEKLRRIARVLNSTG